MTMSSTEMFLSTTDLAGRLRVSARTIQRLVAIGRLSCEHVAGTPVFRVRDVSRALDVAPDALTPGGLLTPQEALARYPGLQRGVLDRMTRAGSLHPVQIGRQVRYQRRALARALAQTGASRDPTIWRFSRADAGGRNPLQCGALWAGRPAGSGQRR